MEGTEHCGAKIFDRMAVVLSLMGLILLWYGCWSQDFSFVFLFFDVPFLGCCTLIAGVLVLHTFGQGHPQSDVVVVSCTVLLLTLSVVSLLTSNVRVLLERDCSTLLDRFERKGDWTDMGSEPEARISCYLSKIICVGWGLLGLGNSILLLTSYIFPKQNQSLRNEELSECQSPSEIVSIVINTNNIS